MKSKIFLFACLLLFSVHAHSQNVNGTILSATNNITVAKVWGTHQERGYAQGYLLGNKIHSLLVSYIIPGFGPVYQNARTLIDAGNDIRFDSVYIKEAQAIIAGMTDAGFNPDGKDYLDLLVANSFLDIQGLSGFDNIGGLREGCSALMSWGDATAGTSIDGKAVASRHLDWSPNATLAANQALVIHVPSEADEQPWAMIGFTGQIGVLSGADQGGLCAFQHVMDDFTGTAPSAMAYEPIWITLRKALERADFNSDGQHYTQDLRDAISANPQGYAAGFIVTSLGPAIAGSDSLTALVAELASAAPLITFRSNAYPDQVPGDNLYAANFEIKRNDHHHYCSRYNAVVAALGTGTGIGAAENWNIMKNSSNQGNWNMQFMQFVPEDLSLKLSVYASGHGAYLNTPVDYSLAQLFAPVTSVNDPESRGPSSVTFFPDPCASGAVLSFYNPVAQTVEIMLTDLAGRTLKTLNEARMEKGWQSLDFSRDGLTAGVYLFRIGSGKTWIVKKVVLGR